ncbi:beta/gamma crystallin domain-containing protein 1-like isoform X2 [Stegostoma tigrinum]|uniref:beta/gamma crystallin domain-containing protein 1-like isoform X2 n=1 Tax=Stegostoma tigrinum TaxID=3053191 RepID=UPI00202B568A|nr:beta/gamma crystallin domain-containing protein 1-like isoform X2 [Stegostoma tigrinum]
MNHYFSFSESDLRGGGSILSAFSNFGGQKLKERSAYFLGSLTSLPSAIASRRASASREELEHSEGSKRPGERSQGGGSAEESRQCQNRVSEAERPKSHPESNQCHNIPDTQQQISPVTVTAAEQKLPGWAEDILNTYLDKEKAGSHKPPLLVKPLLQESTVNSPGVVAKPGSEQSLGDSCESLSVKRKQARDQTAPTKTAKTKYNIIITLTKEEGRGDGKGEQDAAGLAQQETAVPGSVRLNEPKMTEQRLSNQGKPVGRVPYAHTVVCQGNAPAPVNTPLRNSYYSGLGYRIGELSQHPRERVATFQPRLTPRDIGYSRFLQKPDNLQADSKINLQTLMSLPRSLQQAQGLEICQENTNKLVGENSGSKSISNQIGTETTETLSVHVPSEILGGPDSSQISSSTMQHQSNGGLSDTKSAISGLSNSSLQLSTADSKHIDSQKRTAQGDNGVTGSDLPLPGNPTHSSNTIRVSAQQSSNESHFGQGDVLQTVKSSGHTLDSQTPDHKSLVSKTLHTPTSEERTAINLKLDQLPGPQLVKVTSISPEVESLQNSIKYTVDSFKTDITEKPILQSKGTLVKDPAENSKEAGISIVLDDGSQAQAQKFRIMKAGQEDSVKQLQNSRSHFLENELSCTDVFIPNQREKWSTDVSDDTDSLSEIDGFVDTIRNLESPMLLNRNKSPRNQRAHSISSSFSTLPPIEEDQTNPKNSLLSSSDTEKPQQLADTINGKVLPMLPSQPVPPASQIDFSKTLKKEILTPMEMVKMQLEDKPRFGTRHASPDNSIIFPSDLLGKTNLECNADSKNKEPFGAESRWSRLSNSLLYYNAKKPIESFSGRSLDLNSASANPISLSTKSPKHMQRSLSHEDVSTTIKTPDQLPKTTFLASTFESNLMDTQRPSLPTSISERLIPGYSRLIDTNKNLQSRRTSLPSDLRSVTNETARKFTAFPDVWKKTPKDQGKINPRPGKIIIYDKPNFTGFQREIICDVPDCLSWEFPAVISVRVIRGCWVFYEKPNYKGKKFILEEQDVRLTDPWREEVEEETEDPDSKPPPTKFIVIGSLKRVVRDYTIPEVSLFPEADGEGKKLTFHCESEDIRIFGYPPRTTSIIVSSGLWFVYSEPFFEGQQSILEVGGYRTLEEWGAEKPQVGSLIPLQMGPPRVEKPNEPMITIFEKMYFAGRSRDVYNDSSDFLSRYPNTGAALSNAGSLKVYGGIWVGYSKEGFRGHQYLFEEGEFMDWRTWGGHDEDLKSLRLIRAEFFNPVIVLNDRNDDEEHDSIMITESIPDLELVNFGDQVQSMKVMSGVWVAYEGVNYSGAQYIVEKGIYRNPQDWGAQNCKISSLHPILLVEPSNPQFRLKVRAYPEVEYGGRCLLIEGEKLKIPKDFKMQSCRVLNGSWALYEGQDYNGRVFVVGEGEYPDLPSMGCRVTAHIRSVKAIPHVFSEPSVTLYSLENFEGKEIELDSELKNLVAEGYNSLVLSLRVSGGVWVVYEHCNFRGRQVLLEPIEISNWPKYSGFLRIGSIAPVSQKPAFFHIKNKETNDLLSVTLCQEDVKSGRVIVAPEDKELEQLWFYENGLLKPKFAPELSLQTIGALSDTGTKVVLWSEKRIPRHCWTFERSGTIQSLLYKGLVLDIKGGKSYDRDSAIICKHEEENPLQQWEVQML